VVALLTILGGAPADARERVFRLFDQRDGLPAGEIVRLAQDTRGFIWMGSFAGLVRYDGDEMRPWVPERLNGHVSVLITGPRGDVIVRVEPGRDGDVDPTTLYRIVSGGIEPVIGPDGGPLIGVGDAAFGDRGMLCATRDGQVLCQGADGGWIRHAFEGESPTRLREGRSGSVLAMTGAGLWELDPDGAKRSVIELAGMTTVVPGPGGAYFALTFDAAGTGKIVRIAGGGATIEIALDARPIGLVMRNDVAWASFDRFVVAVRPGEAPEVLGREQDIPSGGPLLVDAEGGLWIGTYSGVMHLPEPETIVLNERDGLVSGHSRFVTVADGTMWLGTWQGLARLELTGGRWRPRPEAAPGRDRMCLDGRGRLWMANLGRGLIRHEPGRAAEFRDARMENWLGCSRRADGTLWLSTSVGIFTTPAGDGPPDHRASNPPEGPGTIFFRQIREDRQGRLWVAANERICHAPAGRVLDEGDRAPEWTCQQIPDSRGISAVIELDDGDLWLATDRVGLWHYVDGRWAQMPGATSLPSYSLRGLVRSGDGTVWILGHGTVIRVLDDHESPAGWQVVERLTHLHGLPSAAAEDLYEARDGSLWVTTIVGLVHVPARARHTALRPPAVELVDLIVNGDRRTPPHEPLRLGTADALELRFAALSYRDRGLLRHQYRLHPGARWTTSAGAPSGFQFPDLAPGDYTVEVRASLDGETWTPVPATVALKILPPWYRRTWALLVFALAAGTALYVVHRVRLAVLLGLERQRTRIALDLHDEIGSGLGSINILAGLAAASAPADSPQAGLAGDISNTAAELGASLSEIVWSLRSRSETLDGLMSHLSERAARLFPGESPLFRLAIPESLPGVTLPLAVRWNVSLIAIEALHNAARHARARSVELGLEPAGRRWRLWIRDEGGGVDAAGRGGGDGVGLESMRRRAAEIRAALDVAPNDAGGRTVTLVFDPHRGGGGT